MGISSYLGFSNPSIRVYLVDDHLMMLDGVSKLIGELDGYEVVGRATEMVAAIVDLRVTDVDLLVTDFQLPDGDGLALIRRVKKHKPNLKVIMLSMYDEAHLVKEILKEGVDAYVLKRDSHHELVHALSEVRAGKKYMSDDINRMILLSLHEDREPKSLTDREREILRLVAQEYTNKMIAEALFISERTVETHRKNIFRKTRTSSLVGLIKYAYSNNLI
ncbi:two component transcriptional regulator, LuxR family [Reichenbachiella agariperforans]|uniref:Two component transcriptional regulator, LuxR family n=1 Tax=Reichenbachiella agariperforans TaxID=156994 RepID=A0A1M6M8C1_REIAG|nr:response regulator transcription factor [Reichenbachiella agariperforans]SHJ79513.1 two component transcriptional regulator, LuxR family [Reichenbachiella agariperforans]